MRAPSCQIPKTITEQPQAASFPLPKEKEAEMVAYAKKLRAKWPHMKKDRLMRKVAEHFKVKLV